MNWWCIGCKIAGGDYGPIDETAALWNTINTFHKDHPGWGTTPPEPTVLELADKVDLSTLSISRAVGQADHINKKMAKIKIGNGEGEMTRSDFAYMIMSDNRFVTLEDTEIILYYENGCYHHGGEGRIKKICESMIADCTNTDVKEITGTVQRKDRRKRAEFDLGGFTVCLKNCNVNVLTGQPDEHNPDLLFRSQLPVVFDGMARCPKFVRFLHDCLPDPNDYIDQIEAFACGLLKNIPKLEAMFFETGRGDNGKSTFLNIINWLFGPDNVATVSIHELIMNRFAKARLENRMINTFPDIESDALENFGILKALVSGDAIDAEFKYQNPHTFICHAKLFFSANELPEIKEKTFATFKRIRLTKWMQQFLKPADWQLHKDILKAKMPALDEEQLIDELALSGIRKMNRQFVNSILDDEVERSGIFNLLLIAARNIIRRDGFFNDYTHDQLKELWSENSTMIDSFCQDCLVKNSDRFVPKSKVYQAYHAYCRLYGKPPKQDNVVHPIIQARFSVESTFRKIHGKTLRVYEGLFWNLDHTIANKFHNPDTTDTPDSSYYSKQMQFDNHIIKGLSENPVSHVFTSTSVNLGVGKVLVEPVKKDGTPDE